MRKRFIELTSELRENILREVVRRYMPRFDNNARRWIAEPLAEDGTRNSPRVYTKNLIEMAVFRTSLDVSEKDALATGKRMRMTDIYSLIKELRLRVGAC